MEAASRKSGRVEKEKEGPPESLLAFYFLIFCSSIFFFLQGDGCSTGFPPLKPSFLFVFFKISFFETETKDKAGYDFPSHLNFLVFFPHILL